MHADECTGLMDSQSRLRHNESTVYLSFWQNSELRSIPVTAVFSGPLTTTLSNRIAGRITPPAGRPTTTGLITRICTLPKWLGTIRSSLPGSTLSTEPYTIGCEFRITRHVMVETPVATAYAPTS